MLLAEGRTAEVYAWGADQVLKLYRRAELAAWMLPLAAARLEEGIVAEVESLLQIVANLLAGRRCKLLPRF